MFYNAVKFSLVLLCTLSTFVVLAEKSSIFSAGDAAFAAGDYAIACDLYKANIGKKNSPADAQARLKYIIALIELGKPGLARIALENYNLNYPKTQSGLILGKLYLAENRYDEAKDFFTQQVKSKDKKISTIARYNLAEIEKKLGNKKQAALIFEQISALPDAPNDLKYNAKLSQIHLEIDNKNLTKANKLIKDTPKEPYFIPSLNFTLLSLLLETKENKVDNTIKNWQAITNTPKAEQNSCLSALAFSAYEACERLNKKDKALDFLIEAFKYAPNDEAKKENLQNLIHYAINLDIKKATIWAKKYYEFYPIDQAGYDILISVARSMTSTNLNKEAVEIFKLINKNDNYHLLGRCVAAKEAAIVAEKVKDYDTAHYMHKFLIEKSLTASERQEREINYGEFLLSINQDKDAEKILTSAIAGDQDKSERAYFNLLQLYLKNNDLNSVEKTANILLASTNKEYAALAKFAAANLAQQKKLYEEARKLYLEFIKFAPNDKKVGQAMFQAAIVAMYLGLLNESANELEKFAIQYPKDINAPKALFMAIRSSSNSKEANKRFNLLLEMFPQSEILSISALQFSDMLLEDNQPQNALKILETYNKLAINDEEKADFIYSKAKIISQQKNSADRGAALQLLEKLFKDYPNSNFTREANFMAGDIHFNLGEYRQAAVFFKKSIQDNKDEVTNQISKGRLGDALLNLYKQKEDKTALKEATLVFTELAKSLFPHIKIQSLYKLGECQKYSNNNKEALIIWSRLIYTAKAMQQNNIMPDNYWCEKATYEFISLKLAAKTPKAISEAQRLLRQYESLALPSTENNIERLKKSLKEYYNFLTK